MSLEESGGEVACVECAASSAEGERSGNRLGALVRDVAEAAILAALIFGALQFAVQNTIVEGDSMAPNFVDGQRLLVNKLAYRWSTPQRGDVIVFHAPTPRHDDFLKRVIAVAGERVEIRDGVVFVDGRELPEPWRPRRDHTAFGSFLVPDGTVFVLGDNRARSNDSRAWGTALSTGRIVGRVSLSLWPLASLGIVRGDSVGPGSQAAPR